MMLKYKFKILTILLIALVIVSCDKKLDIEPKQSIDAKTALSTASDVDAAMVGCYSIMGGGALYGCDLLMNPEIQSSYYPDPEQYFSWGGTFTAQREIARKIMQNINFEASRMWSAGYSAINMANIVLANLDVVTDADQKASLEGEALFVRAIMHFELVRIFAQPWDAAGANAGLGIVIKTTPTTTEEEAFVKSPRNTITQVYTQIINDLTAAASKLPEDNGTRADRYTALAFLARVYLQQGNYAGARDAADQVINAIDDNGGPKYKMNASVNAVFDNKNTQESIFEIQQNEQNNAGTSNDGMATFFASLVGIGRADVRVSQAFLDTYDPDDLRLLNWYYVGVGARIGNWHSGKWKSFSQNLPVVRIAEMYLIRAEGNLRLGTNVGASPADDLAEIRNPVRTGLAEIATPTLNDVLAERGFEFAGEGFKIHEIKRLKQAFSIYTWDDERLVFPIPQAEVDATEGIIVQNPGY